MKKIMFSDKYGLTQAVLDGRKTKTRRIIKDIDLIQYLEELDDDGSLKSIKGTIITENNSQYQIGEVVAIAQSYNDIYEELKRTHGSSSNVTRQFFHKYIQGGRMPVSNKMFVASDACLHHIRITDIKVERLQDISDEDVYKEGFILEFVNNNWGNSAYHEEAILVYYDALGSTKQIRSRDPKEAFACLIDKISGQGTWERNPWVFAYTFELLKLDL